MRETRERNSEFLDTVLLFSDIEGSTERWDADASAMRLLLEHHDATVAAVIVAHGGRLVKTTGDGAVGSFSAAADAASATFDITARLVDGPSAIGCDVEPLRVRFGLHRGVVELRDGDMFGPAMHRCARIMSAAHGGQVLTSAVVAAELQLVTNWQLIDRGTHRLKGFHQHERISELVAPGGQPGPAVLRTENAVEGWLPAIDGDEFVGRTGEETTVSQLLAPGRVVTMVGIGGIGKTRLAVRIGQTVRAEFPEGVWFADLTAAADESRVMPAIADALGVVAPSGDSLENAVAAALRNRRLLLILDNCEHVLDGVRTALAHLLGGQVAASVLATSQRDIGLRSEDVVRIGPLPVEAEIQRSTAAQLFIARATTADPSLVIDDDVAASIEAICRRVEGLPLAIELAAARVRVMSVREIADRLAVTFDLLRSRDGVGRHRTLDTAIAWSLDLLGAADRDILLALSVFSSTFDQRSAAAIVDEDEIDVIDSLEELVRRSLLVRVGERLRLLEPVKVHCQTLLAGTDRLDTLRRRHATWMASTVPAPFDDRDVNVVVARLDTVARNLEDLYAAFRYFIEQSPTEAAQLAIRLHDFWLTRGRGQEAMTLMAEIDLDAVDAPLACEVLGKVAYFGWTFGRVAEGEQAGRRSLAMADTARIALPVRSATWLSVRLTFSGRLPEALDLAARAEQVMRSRGDEALLAECLGPLGVVAYVADDRERSLGMVNEAIELARRQGVLRTIGAVSNLLVIAPEHPDSEPLSVEVLRLARAVGRDAVVAHSLLAMAKRRLHAGDVTSFLSGAANYCDMLVDSEPTSVLMTLQMATEAAVMASPRTAAVMLGAVDRLVVELQQAGSAQEDRRRTRVIERLVTTMDAEEIEQARAEGAGLTLDETVDLLRWLADRSLGSVA